MNTKMKPTFFCHNLRDKKQRVTVCGVLDEAAGTLKIGRATCGRDDQFARGAGRTWSRRRACQNPETTILHVVPSDVVRRFYEYIAAETSLAQIRAPKQKTP